MTLPAKTAAAADDDAPPWRLLLDPRGRIARRGFWIWGVAVPLGAGLMLRALLDIARFQETTADGIVNLLLVWPTVAVSIKRWHDRDESGWWVLVALVPVVGWAYMLFVNGFLRGTPGPNRYGPPPLH